MISRWIGVAGTALLAAAPAWAASDQSAQPATRRVASLTASAWAALGKGDAVKAVQDAEAAALLSPRDAENRLLLGRAYLAAGRFASADTAFRDALTLDPALTRASISRALAQIALGQEAAARASLMAAEGHAADADIGLALVLLGDGDNALARLNAAARSQGADARTRQNLGLAYALQGRWSEAVAIAEQDVPADMMPQRLRRWTTIAQLNADRAMQVGAILGVTPAVDQGQPEALALAAPAAAPDAPAVLAAASEPVAPAMLVAPVVHAESGAVVTTTSFTPPALEALAARPESAVVQAGAQPVQAAAAVPAVAAWAGPPRMRQSRVIDASLPRSRKAAKPVMLVSHVSLKPAPGKGAGNWAVQLGAFSSEQRTEIAWGKLSGKARFLNAYTPTGSGLRWGKATLYRLSVSGLPTRAEATSLCVRIKASGGKCFVRNMSGDRPMTWALRSRAEQPV
ncbi:hypothetical protein ASE00_02795 [Sphingomonas sp. Root710]|uniref:SPOR domain-containing protein n=1 Tax=Sphingomonas sp. Root710 TaxID=1736594 RepID=UPI0006FD5A61|nr:SPOR domain-containing protein [Sphingomonas sp. Root710]KRB85721.1 hypothetical protein ASE00_02795 [Sphingomonas sp. Root710]